MITYIQHLQQISLILPLFYFIIITIQYNNIVIVDGLYSYIVQ